MAIFNYQRVIPFDPCQNLDPVLTCSVLDLDLIQVWSKGLGLDVSLPVAWRKGFPQPLIELEFDGKHAKLRVPW